MGPDFSRRPSDMTPRGLFREALWQAKHRGMRFLVRNARAQPFHLLLEGQLRSLDIDTVLDVGANTGQYAHLVRRLGFRGRVISFEPVPALASALEGSAGNDPAWDVLPVALGERNRDGWIRVTEESQLSSFLPLTDFGKGNLGGRAAVEAVQKVPVRRLDSVLPELLDEKSRGRLHLKVDTQGYERQVLEGCGTWLRSIVSLQTELAVQPNYETGESYWEHLQYLAKLGYMLVGLSAVGRDSTGACIEADALFVRGADLAAAPAKRGE